MTESLIREDMQRLRAQRRNPSILLVDDDTLYDSMCSSVFRSPSPYLHESAPGQLGTFYGLQIQKHDQPGWRVLPADFQGYGQGAVR